MEDKKEIRRLTESCFDTFSMWRLDDENIIYYPVHSLEEIPDDIFSFYVRAEFTSPAGIKFKGYLTGITKYYSMGIYFNNKRYIFNKNLYKESYEDIKEIITLINSPRIKKVSDIFPLRYRTNINMLGIRELEGTFDAFERARANGIQFDDQVIE